MKHIVTIIAVLLFAVTTAFAGGPNTYQVTGPVLEVKGDIIVVQKGKDKWEIARDCMFSKGVGQKRHETKRWFCLPYTLTQSLTQDSNHNFVCVSST